MNEVANYNKNQQQINFNQVRGVIDEIQKNYSSPYSSIIVSVGHERKRTICFSIATERLDEFSNLLSEGNLVIVKFYVASKFKNDKWFTNANVISIHSSENN
jgi:hypothetical protein